MIKKTEYAGWRIPVDGKPYKVTNTYSDRALVVKDIEKEGQFHDGETVAIIRTETHEFVETVYTATVKLDKKDV